MADGRGLMTTPFSDLLSSLRLCTDLECLLCLPQFPVSLGQSVSRAGSTSGPPTPLPSSNKSSIHPSTLPYPPCKYSPASSTHWAQDAFWRGSWLVKTGFLPQSPPHIMWEQAYGWTKGWPMSQHIEKCRCHAVGHKERRRESHCGRLQGGGGLRAGP